MAELMTSPTLEQIDRLLAREREAWESLPAVAREWDEWSEDRRLEFVIEWPRQEDGLEVLEQWAADQRLSARQCSVYGRLLGLVGCNRPLIDSLLSN